MIFLRNSVSSQNISSGSSDIQCLSFKNKLFFFVETTFLPQEFLLIIEIISGAKSPSSIFLPTCTQPKSPKEISVCMSANFFWMSWKPAKGDPNCFLFQRNMFLIFLQVFQLPF